MSEEKVQFIDDHPTYHRDENIGHYQNSVVQPLLTGQYYCIFLVCLFKILFGFTSFDL